MSTDAPPQSPYVRLKLLLAPAAIVPSIHAAAGSVSSPSPAVVSYVVKKLEVPRALPIARLLAKLVTLYGLGAPGGCRLQVALDAAPQAMEDSMVDASDKVASLLWEEVRAEDEAAWSAALVGREKVLVRLTPQAAPIGSEAPTPLQLRFKLRERMGVIPAKSPLPWPRFQPDPATLPLIILSNEEHEWELLGEEQFEQIEAEHRANISNNNSATKRERKMSAAVAADANPRAPVSELVAKPHRVVPPELLAKLTGGALAAGSAGRLEGSSVLSAPAPVPDPTTSAITFAVNGATYTIPNPAPTVKLIDFLRYEAGITGAKIGCNEGGCGACTVLLSRSVAATGQTTQVSTNACLHPLALMDGWAVTTSEGLGSTQSGLHPIQTAIVNNWATQCGYCTCGFTMSMYGLLVNNPTPSAQEIEDRFDGNLCRCTGYRPIFKAMRSVVPGLAQEEVAKMKLAGAGAPSGSGAGCGCGSGPGCKCASGQGGCGSASSSSSSSSSSASSSSCGSNSTNGTGLTPCGKGEGTSCSSGAKSACNSVGIGCGYNKKPGRNAGACVDVEDLVLYDPSNPKHQVNPFPPALLAHSHARARALQSGIPRPVQYTADSSALWIVPQSLTDVFAILAHYTPLQEVVKLVVGNSSIGVEKFYPLNPKADNPSVFVPVGEISQLTNVSLQSDALYIGAAVTLTSLIALLEATVPTLPAASVTSWIPLIRHIKMVANTGVRNVASWAGNMMIGKNHPEFPSDLLTIFSAVGASLQLVSGSAGLRNVNVVDFAATPMLVDELVQSIRLPFTPAGMVFDSYKVRSRHQNAHPIINAAYALQFQVGQKGPAGMPIIASSSLVVGGLSQAGPFVCKATQQLLVGQELTPLTLSKALASLDTEAVAVGRLVAGSTYAIADPVYRHSLVLSTFYKFFLEQYSAAGGVVPAVDASAAVAYVRPLSSGSEVFVPDPKEALPLGQAVPKIESAVQASGEAKYTDDATMPPNGLFGAYVYSTVGVADIASIDASAALAMPGVVRFISAADIPSVGGANDCGSFPGDEEVFASTKVTATGQAIGMVLADTRRNAEQAARAVIVNYTNIGVPIVTIAQAIAAKSFFPDNQYLQNPTPVSCGDFATAYAAAPMKLSGNMTTGGQPHFCMETQTCMATPAENDAIYVQSSSQGPTDIRAMVMRVTGLPAHKVVVSTRRVGGGFGSKLSRSHPIASAVALAARITKRPVRSQCDRDSNEDMWGKRSHMYMEYQVGFNAQGKILALNVTFYQLGGHTYEANFGAMQMCLLWADNAYFVPNMTVSGVTCRTNTPSNTAMRGPGAMKSIWHMEAIMEAVAVATGMEPNAVREANFYQEGQLTPYGQPVTSITMPSVWSQLQTQANYAGLKTSVAAFNAANKWRKRGVHMSAVKYGIQDPGNQVGLLLNVMQDDGTIIVSHTGVELGQGINTKVAQTVAAQLGIDISLIIVDDNATNIVCNGSQTGGSATSEAACAAAILACTELNNRLAVVRKPGVTWPVLIAAAAGSMINLTVNAQYNVAPPASATGPFTYFVYSAACSVVELDVLTGEVQVLSSDIVYDAGDSLNPAVDIGQIEGAFVLGLGHYLTEEVIFDEQTARLLSRGTWDNHPPSSQDIPLALNVTLLAGSPNNAPATILGTKASAEPPMMLSCSLFFAVRDCIAAVRADRGLSGWFDLPTPASTANVQLACGITADKLVL